MRFHREHSLERAGRAPESTGNRVGIDLESLHMGMVDTIGTSSARAADARLSGFHSGIGAAAMNGPEVSGHETTVPLDSRAHRDHRIVIRIGERKLFRIG